MMRRIGSGMMATTALVVVTLLTPGLSFADTLPGKLRPVDLSTYYAEHLGLNVQADAWAAGGRLAAVGEASHRQKRIVVASAATRQGAVRALLNAPQVSDGNLASTRGGFALPNGLTLNFGFEITTAINNTIVQSLKITPTQISSSHPTANVSISTINGSQNQILNFGQQNTSIQSIVSTNNGLTSIATTLGNSGVTGLISNQANGQLIQQIKTLNIDISGISNMITRQASQSMLSTALAARNYFGR